MVDAFLTLYKEGGIPRFYRGLIPALIQGPLSRFGDTAANTGALAVLDAFEATAQFPVFIKTAFASVAAALFRIVLMPIDTIKTTMQVEGQDGLTKLLAKFRVVGISTFYQGIRFWISRCGCRHVCGTLPLVLHIQLSECQAAQGQEFDI
eukprot:gene13758-18238_t